MQQQLMIFSVLADFYRAAYMQRGLSYGKGVCLSVRPSHAWIDKTNESSAEILIPYER